MSKSIWDLSLISKYLNKIGESLDSLSSKYDNFMLVGDLNVEPTEGTVSDFCEIYISST